MAGTKGAGLPGVTSMPQKAIATGALDWSADYALARAYDGREALQRRVAAVSRREPQLWPRAGIMHAAAASATGSMSV